MNGMKQIAAITPLLALSTLATCEERSCAVRSMVCENLAPTL